MNIIKDRCAAHQTTTKEFDPDFDLYPPAPNQCDICGVYTAPHVLRRQLETGDHTHEHMPTLFD